MNWQFDTSYLNLPDAFFSSLRPTPVREPKLVIFNRKLAETLGLDLGDMDNEALAALFAGNKLPEGATPFAQAYAGHQFGTFTMLGDGRAIVLGEHLAPDGKRYDIQFKGSGQTPYSRRGDGRAALGPMLREYVISEAMHSLGIATTRSLAVVTTGEPVFREEVLAGAVLTRVASSHLRVGTFEYAAARRDAEALGKLVAYAVERHYPDLAGSGNKALALLQRVCERQAGLISEWMRVGFVHGVMNTDNMAISGETIDYGPCAFIDQYDPATTFSSIDRGGRYAFGNQPGIAQWNLARFAEALLALIDPDQEKAIEMATESVVAFEGFFMERWLNMMRRKLGLIGEETDDSKLANDLLSWMHQNSVDYTLAFARISKGEVSAEDEFAEAGFREWHARWKSRLSRNAKPVKDSLELMRRANPVYIPRNHKVEEALDAACDNGDLAPFNKLLDVLSRPYEERDGLEAYLGPDIESSGRYQTFCGT